MGRSVLLCSISVLPALGVMVLVGGADSMALLSVIAAPLIMTVGVGWLLSSETPRPTLAGPPQACPCCGENVIGSTRDHCCPMCGWNGNR